MKYFYPEKPILVNITQQDGANLINVISNSGNYIAEKKYNGSRLELFYTNGRFEFWNRHGEKLKYRPSDNVVRELRIFGEKLEGDCIFDGELRHNKVEDIRDKIVLYDIFVWDGIILTSIPFAKRRKLLEKILPVESEPLGITRQYTSDFKNKFSEFILEPEIEGIVIKKLSGTLNLSRTRNQDSRWMYKVRRSHKNYRF